MPVFDVQTSDGRKFQVDAPDMQQASAGLQSYAASKPAAATEQPKDLSWGDVASQAWQNAPKSALEFGKGMVQPFIHPVETMQSLGNVEAGALQKAGVMSGKEYVPTADAVGTYFKDRYGGVDQIKKSLATDPVGVAGDLSVLLTGGGSALAKAPGVIGKVGEVARAVGDVANPVAAVARPAEKVLGAAGKAEKIVAPTTEELKDAASAAYNHPAIKELTIDPNAVKAWKDAHSIDMNNDGFNDMLAPKTFGTLTLLDKPPTGAVVTGQNLDTVRKMLGKVASSADPTEREAARATIESLDKFVGTVPASAVIKGDPAKVASVLKEARGNYAAAKRSEAIETALDKASLQAGAANSGMNVDNATRQRLKDILSNPKRRRGFSDDELAQMRKVVVGSPVANLARRGGNMLGGGGGLGTTLVAAGGAYTAGPLGAVAPVIGYGLKKLSAALTASDVKKLQDLVASRSPLGKQMQSTMQKWTQASVSANGSATPRNVSRLLLASRALSKNLADAGIQIEPDHIASASVDPSQKSSK
jgi:hypothetical protein